jgi:hypothetical protein
MSRTALVALLALVLVHEASAAAKCMEFSFKPSKGECKDKEVKMKRCVSDTMIKSPAELATNALTKDMYALLVKKIEIDPYDISDETVTLTKPRCVQFLMQTYSSLVNQMSGYCGTKPGTDDSAPESMSQLKLNGVSKVPYGPPGSSCDCNKYVTMAISSGLGGAECDKDEECREYGTSDVKEGIDRICCDSYKKSIDRWCKDYDEGKVTALKNYYAGLDEATNRDKCYTDKCITWTSSASSALPHLLFSGLVALLALAKLY